MSIQFLSFFFFFFFQAEDGIRDVAVTGVQTCALPISAATVRHSRATACASLRRELTGEPDAGKSACPVRGGESGSRNRAALSPTLPVHENLTHLPQVE